MVMATVDVAIFNEDYTKILLGKKANEDQYRLIGGFADPGSDSYEADARREVREETGLSITDPEYIGSYRIDDWRYRGEPDRKIKTLLFVAKVFSGSARAADDIAEVRWFEIDDLHPAADWVIPNHRPLIEASLRAI
jgi:bifunctional NMN adenylyltransferase/nudix hydrolase